MAVATKMDSLRSRLNYEPQELGFGTSGRRGKVVDLTQLEIYLNALAELEYLQSLAPSEGGIKRGDPFYFASDLRPSSSEFVSQEQGRGEIAQAIVAAIRDAGMQAVNLGRIPTPALANFALSRNKGSIMVTGSHIPFDRNGYKTNSSRGELLKQQEAPINEQVGRYARGSMSSPEINRCLISAACSRAVTKLYRRKTALPAPLISSGSPAFSRAALAQRQALLVYQHSAVGRDLLVEILERLGAQVVKGGTQRNVRSHRHRKYRRRATRRHSGLADEATERAAHSAVVSTDGDSDRPLVLGVDPRYGCISSAATC